MKIVPGDSTHRYQRHEHWHRLKQTTGTQKRWPNSLPRYFKSMAISSSLLSLTLSFSTSRSHQFSLIQAASPTKNLWSGSRPWGARAARRRRGGACELAAGANAAGLRGWPGAGRGGQARAQVPGGRFGGQDQKGSLTRRSFLCSDSALPPPVPVRRAPPPRCRSIGAFGELPLQSIY